MPILHAIILAVVQGLTEFLPISSTAHLVLLSYFAGWPEQGLAFDVALHVGTLAAVVLYFIRDWFELALAGFGIRPSPAMRDEDFSWKRRLFWLLVVGTIPGGIAGILFEKTVEDTLSKPIPIACALILVGLLMWWADRLTNLDRHVKQSNLTDALVVGTAQAFAIFPGVSRSGSTIIAGMWRRFTRESAARFSFLLSTPLIAGAALKEVPKLIHERHAGGLDLPMSTLLIGIVVSGLVGYAVIAFFLRYLQTRTLKVFVVYRIALGILVLLFVLLHLGSTR
ncbi:MAG TPA: undecaprenyl-diphosphatase UppP [Candidatus Limnocylindrales bacterium]|nr:undecaprenyl-diphosphatase UppP [Candidatus Limnocylindrales bacterium]